MTTELFSMAPDFRGQTSGKNFEAVVLQRLADEERFGNGCFDRSGVKAVVRDRRNDGTVIAQVMKSRTDIDGILPGGREINFDCKVESGASFDLSRYREDVGSKAKAHQIRFMKRRAKLGAICGFLIHWNSRELKRSNEPAETYFFPVNFRIRFWQEFESYEQRSINRLDCAEFGFKVPWNKRKAERKYRPDLMSAFQTLRT